MKIQFAYDIKGKDF